LYAILRPGLERFDATLASSFRSARVLDLSSNKLRDIDPAAWRPLTELRRLDLSRNLLSRLPADFAQHFSTVQWLNLSANTISHVDAAALSGMTRLRQLDLSHNRIQVMQ